MFCLLCCQLLGFERILVPYCPVSFYYASSYASAVLAVVGLILVILSLRLSSRPSVRPSIRLSVTRMLCDNTKQRTADILIPHENAKG